MRDRALIVALALTISSVTLVLLIIIALSSQNTSNTRLTRSLKENRQTDEPSQPISTAINLKGAIDDTKGPNLGTANLGTPNIGTPSLGTPDLGEPGTQIASKAVIVIRPTPIVPSELRFYTEVDRRLEEFYLTTLNDQFVNLQPSTLTEEPEQSYYYDPIAHAIIDHQNGRRVSIVDSQNPSNTKYLLYKKKGENLVLLLTQDMRPVVMVDSNQPLSFRVKRKMSGQY